MKEGVLACAILLSPVWVPVVLFYLFDNQPGVGDWNDGEGHSGCDCCNR